MRIIHTSDWHIGHKLYGNDRTEEHKLFFDWLITYISANNTDVLIIAGDIFDGAYPSNSALELYYSFLTRLLKTGCKNMIIIGGNHDSVSTLNAPKQILKYLNIRVFGGIEEELDKHFVYLRDTESELVIAAIPFLRDKDIMHSVAGQSFDQKIESLKSGLIDFYKNVSSRVNQKYPDAFKLFTGHFYSTGSLLSDSERYIHFGNQGEISLNKLPNADYWALGHIHRPQKVGDKENIRYSGSPLPLSFSERKDQKIIIDLDLQKSGLNINEIKVPIFRSLKRISGSLQDVYAKIVEIENNKSLLKTWLELIIKQEKFNPDDKVDFIYFISELDQSVVLKYKFEAADANTEIQNMENKKSLKDFSNLEVFEHFLQKKGIEANDEIKYAYNEIVQSINY